VSISLKTDDLDLDSINVSEVFDPLDRPESVTRSPRGRALALRILALVGAITIYSVYRNLRVGAGRDVFSRGLPVQPFRHALTVLKVEHALWIDFEQGLQHIFLSHGLIIRFANAYYSWAHQWVSLGLVAAVLLKAPWGKAWRWVTALLLQLPIALVLFRLYPLMPPRLVDAGAPWGGRILAQHRQIRPSGIVDTLTTFRGPWSPPPVAINSFTNQFAAMPSLHCGFAMWVGVVWWQYAKGKKWRILGPLHTAVIFFCVVVTGNHWVLDAVVGWAIALVLLGVTGRFSGLRRLIGSYRASEAQPAMTSMSSSSRLESVGSSGVGSARL
jgi:hypothetical protein